MNDIPLTGHVLERNLRGGLEELLSRLEGTSRGQRDLHGMLDKLWTSDTVVDV